MKEPRPNPVVLTVEDLALRWNCAVNTILTRVQNPDNPVPFFNLALPPKGGTKRKYQLIRFRLKDIESWEAEQIRVIQPAEVKEPTSRPATYTGTKHLEEPRKKPARRRATKP